MKFSFKHFLFFDIISIGVRTMENNAMKKFIRQKRKFFFLFFLFMALLFILIYFSLMNYLYQIQRTERLSKLDEDETYTLSYSKQNRCKTSYIFTYDNYKYYYDCLNEVYISYGSTGVFLQDALNNKYVTLDDLITDTVKKTVNSNKTIYYHHSSIEGKSYKIAIEDQTITIGTFTDEEWNSIDKK